jgi:hypothetical protein
MARSLKVEELLPRHKKNVAGNLTFAVVVEVSVPNRLSTPTKFKQLFPPECALSF